MNSHIDRLTYAVGDIHGYDELFERLIDRIRVDAELAGEKPRLILLGDYIDRGPNARGVLQRILRLETATWCDLVALMGNHEHILLRFLDEPDLGETWRVWGGAATLASYGVDMPYFANDTGVWRDVRDRFRAAMDRDHLDLLRRMPASFAAG
ncbi:MAG: metallophosphoesterase, partial [Asticcacaulis sp.]|nr:metallophosphoesterase [Asticcacaulis sp.]